MSDRSTALALTHIKSTIYRVALTPEADARQCRLDCLYSDINSFTDMRLHERHVQSEVAGSTV